jgi:acyl transferase domain-containing protein
LLEHDLGIAGEIACGYGDTCFTREQTVLVAYHRGRMCPEHGISGGLMAAVGLGVEDAEARLAKYGKESCVVGCDNSPNSVTLSGQPASAAVKLCNLESLQQNEVVEVHMLEDDSWRDGSHATHVCRS